MSETRVLQLGLLAPGEIFGGAERQMVTLCSWLREQGISPAILLFHYAALARELRANGFDPIILPGSRAFSMTAVRALQAQLERLGINVLHFHGYKAAVHAWLATRSLRVALVKTEHGAIEIGSEALVERAKIALYRSLDTFATRRMKPHIVYVTRELAAHFAAGHRGLEQTVIYNGLGATAAAAGTAPEGYLPERRNVLALGRLEQVKGLEHALRALALTSMPAEVVLHVVGDGPQRGPLERLAASLSLDGRVAFHGFRSNPHDYLAHADALLMPSMHEGLPYVLLEAMLLGLPTIASKVGGLEEVLADGTTALLIEPANPQAIAAAARRLFEEPGLRQRLRSNAHELARTKFSADSMGRGYLDVYHRALETLAPNSRITQHA